MSRSTTHPSPASMPPPPGLSPAAGRLFQQAAQALAAGRLDDAERGLLGVLAMAPGCAEALRLMAAAQRLRGDPAASVATLRQAGELAPASVDVLMDLGIALFECGRHAEALVAVDQALALAPDRPALHFNRARMLKLTGADPGQALHEALRLDPQHVSARLMLADLLTSRGEIAAAHGHYREVLRRQPGHPRAWLGLANLKTVPLGREDVARLRQAMARPGLTDEARVALGFSLAVALEDQGDHRQAFDILRQANRLQRRQQPWDARRATAEIEAIMRAFDAPVAGAESELGHEVIFVVSLPRAGSSLTEQILASHPEVEGGNELLDLHQVLDDESARRGVPFPGWVPEASAADWTRLGRDYLARTARLRTVKPRSTDKNLLNWQLVGAAMAMLPGARVVHCQRDAVETCLACFRQLFARGNGFTYDLGDMVAYWRDYQRACALWRRRFPGRFFELSLEALQADPEGQTRRLLEACRLPFDPACLEFHRTGRQVLTASAAQVRQPLRRDTARAAQYGDRLDRLRAMLAEAGWSPSSP